MRSVNLTVVVIGALVALLALAVVEGMPALWFALVLSPYVALGILDLIVHAKVPSTAARRALLADSCIIVTVSAWLYVPIIVDLGGSCMVGMVFFLAVPLLIAVPILFALGLGVLKFLEERDD